MNDQFAGVLQKSHLLPHLSSLLLSFLLGLWVVPTVALGDPVAEPQVGGYTLVAKRLLSRLDYELTYTAQLTNPGPALQDVQATLTVQVPGVTVLEGTLEFGDVPAHTTVPSRDTFQVRHDRRYTFGEADLVWAVTSRPGNIPPVAYAGPDQHAFVGAPVTLDGSASSDPDGDPLTFQWSLTRIPLGSAVALSDPTAVTPTFTVDTPGTYVAQLLVNDSTANSAPDSTTVTAEALPAPGLAVTPLHLDFGAVPVGTSASLRLDIANSGTADLVVTGFHLTGTGFGLSYPTPFTLPAGAPGEPVTVTFHPDTAGAFTGTVAVQSNAGTAEVTLQGVGEPPPVAKSRLYFIHNDHLGTPHFLTDEKGTEVWRAHYEPFGKATVDEDPDGDGKKVTFHLRFPGQYYDTESGLHYNGHRYYDPATGRYITPDPLGLEGGLNPYVYVYNNPLYWADPLGFCPMCIPLILDYQVFLT